MKKRNNTPQSKNDTQKRRSVKEIVFSVVIDVLLAVLIILVILMIVFRCNYQGFYVVGDSMLPTVIGATDENSAGGEYIYVNKHKTPDYGDIVTINVGYLNPESTKSRSIIKRVIAKEGDYVKIEHNCVYVRYAGTDGYVALEEDYLADDVYMSTYYHNGPIAEGCIFVLGDNREISNDSRKEFGDIPVEYVYGVFDDLGQSIRKASTNIYTFFTYDIKILFNK